jgi:uncharacterized membrane protein YcaP (DUF421 family)
MLSRLIGKQLLGQLTFYDFVTGITLGTIGGGFVTTEVKGNYILLSATVFAILALITGYITLKNETIRKLVEGRPVIFVDNGKILERNMLKERYNLEDLMMQLREKNIFDLNQVKYAILEPHGKLSVIKQSDNYGISMEVIREGKILQHNLMQQNLTHEWLYNQLMLLGVKDIKDIFIASLSSSGQLYIDLVDKE